MLFGAVEVIIRHEKVSTLFTDIGMQAPVESIPGHPRWWQWPTILALDAPAVTIAWQCLFARIVGSNLQAHHIVLLGLSVWLAYSADRWIEGWRLTAERVRTQRHYFVRRWRWWSVTVWLVTLVVAVALATEKLSKSEWLASFGMLAATLLYVVSHQSLHRNCRWRVPKEICVAVILAFGAALYPAVLAHASLPLLIAPMGILMLLCLSNCLLISEWEYEVDILHGQKSLALEFTHSAILAAVMPYITVLVSLAFLYRATAFTRAAGYCGVTSGVGLAILHLTEPKMGRELARLLADVALLSPVFALLPR